MRTRINPALLKALDNRDTRLKMASDWGVGETTIRNWLSSNPIMLTQYDKIEYLKQWAKKIKFKQEVLDINTPKNLKTA